jgi:hypothetical protein
MNSEQRVAIWFLAAFMLGAVVLVTYTFVVKSRECAMVCAQTGNAGYSLKGSGGGRLENRVQCECVARN